MLASPRISDRICLLQGVACTLPLAFSLACASSAVPPSAGAKPPLATEATAISSELSVDEQVEQMDLVRAEELVAAIWPLPEGHELANPKSLQDVERVLKLDQINLFPNAIAFAAEQEGLDPLALHGQIELAWGETYVLLIEILSAVQTSLEKRAEQLEGQAVIVPLGPEQQAEFDRTTHNIDQLRLRVAALKLLGVEHMATGSQKANELIAAQPTSHLGYRLAADYYRIMRDWEKFEAMLAKLQETNPDSNGLLFLKGASTFQREKDKETASRFYHQALDNDPDFLRVQAHLLVIQSEIKDTHAELLKLEARNPQHPFALLAGESIKEAYAQWQATRYRL